MADSTVYAIDEGGNRIPTLSGEKIIEAIQTAIATGEIPDELQTFIDTIKEQNKGAGLKFWLGTQAEFLALESTSEDVIYFINDSANLRDVANALDELKKALQDGSFVVKKATAADEATNVKTNINGKAINSIFESNGTTVKEATHAAAAETINKYQHNVGMDISAHGTYFGRVRCSFISSFSSPIEYDGELIERDEIIDVPIMAVGVIRVGTAGFCVVNGLKISSEEGCIILSGFYYKYQNPAAESEDYYDVSIYQDYVKNWVDRVIKL